MKYLILICCFLLIGGCTIHNQPPLAISNPSSEYCIGLGYTYLTEQTNEGQRGICKIDMLHSCDAWDFINGLCETKSTLCEKGGGKIIQSSEGCKFSSECGICLQPDGKECNEWDNFKGKCS